MALASIEMIPFVAAGRWAYQVWYFVALGARIDWSGRSEGISSMHLWVVSPFCGVPSALCADDGKFVKVGMRNDGRWGGRNLLKSADTARKSFRTKLKRTQHLNIFSHARGRECTLPEGVHVLQSPDTPRKYFRAEL